MKLTVCYQTPRKRQDMTRVKISKTACWCQVGWQPVIWDLVHLKWCPWTQTRLLFTPQMLFIYLLFFLIREGKIGFIVCQLSRQLSGKIIFNYELWCLRFVSWNPSPFPPPPRHVIGHAQSVYKPFFNCLNRYRPQRYISSIFRRAWRIRWV